MDQPMTIDHDTAATISAEAEALDAGATVEHVPLSQLCESPFNVRLKEPDPQGIEALALNIYAKRILQNLVVHRMTKGRGKKLGVAAGRRRYRALLFLLQAEKITLDYLVPVRIVSEAEAYAASLIENVHREPMHPADQFDAFRKLIEGGKTIEYVAAVFGVQPLTVRRHLRLCSVSPKLFALFRNDEIEIEQLQALALSQDHAQQEALWFGAQNAWQRSAENLRAAITDDEISARTHPLAQFVGVARYEAAGGVVRRDLFSEGDDVYFSDIALLQRLATESLEEVASRYREEGWSWADARDQIDYTDFHQSFVQMASEARKLSKKERAELKSLEKELAEVEAAMQNGDEDSMSDEEYETLETRAQTAQARIEQINAAARCWTDEAKAAGGVVITIGHGGRVDVREGVMRRADVKQAPKSLIDSQELEGGHRLFAEKPLHGETLCRRLTAHRTAAVQAELAEQPGVALVVLAHRLALSAFYDGASGASALQLSPTRCWDRLEGLAPDMRNNPGFRAMEEGEQQWRAQLPRDPNNLFDWLLALPRTSLDRLLAFLLAQCVDGVSGNDSAHPVNAVRKAVNLDMTKYWSATADAYFAHVSKARIVEVVAKTASEEKSKPLASAKKAEAAAAAEDLLRGRGWMPEPLANMEVESVIDFDFSGDQEQDDDTE